MSRIQQFSDTILDTLNKKIFSEGFSSLEITLKKLYKEVRSMSWPEHSDIIKTLRDVINRYIAFVIF